MPSLGHISIEFNGYLGNFRKDGQIKISVGKKQLLKVTAGLNQTSWCVSTISSLKDHWTFRHSCSYK